MTLQERYDAIKADSARVGQQIQQGRAQVMQLEQQAIRADAQMVLLETLMKEAGEAVPAAGTPLPFAPAKKRRGKKPESDVA